MRRGLLRRDGFLASIWVLTAAIIIPAAVAWQLSIGNGVRLHHEPLQKLAASHTTRRRFDATAPGVMTTTTTTARRRRPLLLTASSSTARSDEQQQSQPAAHNPPTGGGHLSMVPASFAPITHVARDRAAGLQNEEEPQSSRRVVESATKKRKHTSPSTLNVSLVEARPADLADVAALLVASFFEGSDATFLAVVAHRELRRLAEHHGGEKHWQTVARLPCGAVVGFVDLDFRPKPGGDATRYPRPYISDLAVRPEYRRRGVHQHANGVRETRLVGNASPFAFALSKKDSLQSPLLVSETPPQVATRLVARCEAIAAAQGAECVYLKVETSNAVALRMYANRGYDLWHRDDVSAKATLRKDLIRRETRDDDDIVAAAGSTSPPPPRSRSSSSEEDEEAEDCEDALARPLAAPATTPTPARQITRRQFSRLFRPASW